MFRRQQQKSCSGEYADLFGLDFYSFPCSLCKSSMCKPVKMKMEQAALMTDDDFLLAELNGHFQ
jgi:hypothetical protein